MVKVALGRRIDAADGIIYLDFMKRRAGEPATFYEVLLFPIQQAPR